MIKLRSTVLAIILGLVLLVGFTSAGELKVHFMDVGQADSILVQTPSGDAILIDGGNVGDARGIERYLKANSVGKLSALIATHPHEDHIGGLPDIIRKFKVDKIYMPSVSHTTQIWEDFIAAVKESEARRIVAKKGVKVELPGVEADMLAPIKAKYEELNDYSAVLQLSYGAISFLFTGDAEAISETDMLLSAPNSLQSTVLKVGHHGSATSTSDAFLKAVAPKYAVISVGVGNNYDLPDASTIEKFQETGTLVRRTDMEGTIVAITDGNRIEFKSYVYQQGKGKIYHRLTCSKLSNQATVNQLPLFEAISQGLTSCVTCRPPKMISPAANIMVPLSEEAFQKLNQIAKARGETDLQVIALEAIEQYLNKH